MVSHVIGAPEKLIKAVKALFSRILAQVAGIGTIFWNTYQFASRLQFLYNFYFEVDWVMYIAEEVADFVYANVIELQRNYKGR